LANYNVDLTVLTTSTNTKIIVFSFKYPGAKFTIIYSHGNATDCGAMFLIYALIATSLRVNVVAYDYTGYGPAFEEEARPSEKQSYSDIDCVYQWCINSQIVSDPQKEIILYGQSVGSGPSCYLASSKPVAGLILHSPITSGMRVLTQSRILSCWDIFPNIDRISKVTSPVFIMHGMWDQEVPFEHGTSLNDAGEILCRFLL